MSNKVIKKAILHWNISVSDAHYTYIANRNLLSLIFSSGFLHFSGGGIKEKNETNQIVFFVVVVYCFIIYKKKDDKKLLATLTDQSDL